MKIDFDLPPPLPNERGARRTKETGRQSHQNSMSVPRGGRSNEAAGPILPEGEPHGPSTSPGPARLNLEAIAQNQSEAPSTPRDGRNVDLRFAIAALIVIGLTLFPFAFFYYKASAPIQEHDQRADSRENTPETARQKLPSPNLPAQSVPLPSPEPNVMEVPTPLSTDTPTSMDPKQEAENALNTEYDELRRSLSKKEREALKRDQAKWLHEREKVRNNPSEYLRMTWQRVQDLNHSHTHSGE